MSTPSDRFSLEDKTAFVTGANSGIGRGIARGFRAAGAKVAFTGRNPEKNAAMAEELGNDGLLLAVDVRDESAVNSAMSQCVNHFGGVDILVNNAGQSLPGSLLGAKTEDWKAVLDTHLNGSFFCSRAAANAMIEGGRGGKVLNVGSMYSVYGSPRISNYSTAKTGVLGMTRSWARELADHNIQVNAILPGWFGTEMTAAIPGTHVGNLIRHRTPAGRWGIDEDIAPAAVFLCSNAADFITGVSLPVDGGYSISDGLNLSDWAKMG